MKEKIMATYGVYRVTEKKCATCSFWVGGRTIDFRAYKPYYVKADSGHADCIAQKGKKNTPAAQCQKWKLWEKL